MKTGCLVKIEDVGPLATVIEVAYRAGKKMVHLALEGEKFWMPAKNVKAVSR